MPSEKLIEGGVVNKPLKYHGNKLLKKAKEHNFNPKELKNLPIAIANPIAVFNNYKNDDNRSILTELKMKAGNVLVAVSVGDGVDIDFNIIRSTFGENSNKIENWIKQGLFTYIDKKKILNYQRLSAPIAVTTDNPESFSDRKGTTNSRADQTNSEKNSGNLQGGEDVNIIDKDVVITNIKTAFGRNLENAINNNREEFIYPYEIKKTDERAAPNSLAYTQQSFLSDGKGTTNSRTDQRNLEKNSKNMQGGEDVMFSISAEQDRGYMAAVESGDMEKAGAMEKAAFKARFPWVSAPVSLTIS